MILNAPTLLTLFRIVLIPVLVLVFYLPFSWAHFAATFVFWLAAVTDILDGYLARRMGLTSNFGAFLDPVADKLIVAVALVLIVDENPTPYHDILLTLPAVVIIGREIVISALREWMAELGERTQVAVSTIGKIKTNAQMFAIMFLLYQEPLWGMPMAEIGFVLLYIAAVLTLWSMFIYLRAALPILVGKSEK